MTYRIEEYFYLTFECGELEPILIDGHFNFELGKAKYIQLHR